LLERQLACSLPNAVVYPGPIRSRPEHPLPWPDGTSDAVHFATVARYEVGCKSQDQTLEAFSTPEWKSRDWTLDLFGSGPDEAYLKKLICYYGLEKHVFLTGYERDFRKVWSGRHVHILNSRLEGLTLALIESMFCGRPAIITRAGGNHELVRDGLDGFVRPGMDPDIIRETLEVAWARRSKWREMGESAFERANGWIPKDLGFRVLQTIMKPVNRK
jgi:glycosyltransferase involved in cell wall biosynthesis